MKRPPFHHHRPPHRPLRSPESAGLLSRPLRAPLAIGLALLAALPALPACSDGAKGAAGDPGAPANAPTPTEASESVSLVTPGFGVLARTTQITLAVDAYKLIDPTVDFGGAGVKVTGLALVNEASILATVEIAADAKLGERDVTITDEGKKLVATAAFKIVPALEATVSGGSAAQGALVRIDLKNRDRVPLAPASFEIVSAKASSPTLSVLARGYLTATDGQFVFIADPRAATGPLQFVAVNDPDDPDSPTFLTAPDAVDVSERSARPIVPGTPLPSEALAAELATGFFRYASPANAIVDIRVSDLGAKIAPVLDAMPPTGTLASEYDYRAPNRPGALAYVNTVASVGDFLIVSDAAFGGGTPADYKYTLSVVTVPGTVVPESATPHPAASPQDLGALPAAAAATPAVIVNGDLVAGDTADVYRVDAGGTSKVQIVAMTPTNHSIRFHPTDPACPTQTSQSLEIQLKSDAVDSIANVGAGFICVLPSQGSTGKYTIAARRLP